VTYMKIPIDEIDPNPFQTRKDYPKDVTAGIMASLGRHGILQPPMVRPNNGRYETVFGHGRIQAAKHAGLKEIDCRVEVDVTDEEMKKYVLQENVLRSDLSEDERMAGLEQYRKDLGLEPGEYGFYAKMHDATGVPEGTLLEWYFVKEVKKRLKILGAKDSRISARVIARTRGLEEKDQINLIIKVSDKGWSSEIAFRIKAAVKDIDPRLRTRLLDKETDLPWKVIVALAEIDPPENALKIIDFITTRRLDEKTALIIIEDAKKGIFPTYETKVSDEYKRTYDKFVKINKAVNSWGYNHYQIVKDHWNEIDPILTNIENKIQEFRRFHRG